MTSQSVTLARSPYSYVLPTEEFYNFGKLPRELRWAIWNIAASVPRVVEFRLRRDQDFVPQSPPPAVLQVNQESRQEALKHFDVAFESYYAMGRPTTKTFFNFDSDTFLLNGYSTGRMGKNSCLRNLIEGYKYAEDKAKLKQIAVSDEAWYRMLYSAGELLHKCEAFEAFRSLKTIYLIRSRHYLPSGVRHLEFRKPYRAQDADGEGEDDVFEAKWFAPDGSRRGTFRDVRLARRDEFLGMI